MTTSEIAGQYFSGSFNCSQSVLAALGPGLGLSEEQCLKLGCAFGGGMARQQMICGAVTGAMLALGLHFGRGKDDPYEQTGITYQKTLEFFNRFMECHGSVSCLELLHGLNMNDPEDNRKIQDQNLFKTECLKYVKDAADIAENIISGSAH